MSSIQPLETSVAVGSEQVAQTSTQPPQFQASATGLSGYPAAMCAMHIETITKLALLKTAFDSLDESAFEAVLVDLEQTHLRGFAYTCARHNVDPDTEFDHILARLSNASTTT